MLCYKDMTFCVQMNCKNFGPCERSLTDEVTEAAAEWWGGHEAPIAIYSEPPSCFEPKEEAS